MCTQFIDTALNPFPVTGQQDWDVKFTAHTTVAHDLSDPYTQILLYIDLQSVICCIDQWIQPFNCTKQQNNLVEQIIK